jgi:hypothetical protein
VKDGTATTVGEDDSSLLLRWEHGHNQILSEGIILKLPLVDETDDSSILKGKKENKDS